MIGKLKDAALTLFFGTLAILTLFTAGGNYYLLTERTSNVFGHTATHTVRKFFDPVLAQVEDQTNDAVFLIHTPDIGHGTGFLIDKERRLVVTNYHVVHEQINDGIVMQDRNGIHFTGRVVHFKSIHDLAIIQVSKELLDYHKELKLANTFPRLRQELFGIGHGGYNFFWGVRVIVERPYYIKVTADGFRTSIDHHYQGILFKGKMESGHSGSPIVDENSLVYMVLSRGNREMHIGIPSIYVQHLYKQALETLTPRL